MRRMTAVIVLLVSISVMGSAHAQMGLSGESGNWNIRPFVELGVTYDDNVYRTGSNEVDDFYFDPTVGLLFRTSSQQAALSLSGGAMYNRREYLDEDDRSSDSYGAGLSLDYGTGGPTELQAVGSYRKIESEDTLGAVTQLRGVERGLIQDIDSTNFERDVYDAGAALSHRFSDRTSLQLGGMYTAVDYDRPESLDLTGIIGQAVLEQDVTDKAGVFGVARIGRQEQDGDNATADSLAAQLGLKLATTDRINLRVGVGAQRFTLSRPSVSDDDTDSLSASLSLTWQATDRVVFSAGGYNGTQLSSAFSDNAIEFINAFIGMTYEVSDAVNVSLRGVYRRDDYVNPVARNGVSADRKDDRYQIVARINYRPPVDYLQLYTQVSVEEVDSSIDAIDYTRTVVSVGLGLAY